MTLKSGLSEKVLAPTPTVILKMVKKEHARIWQPSSRESFACGSAWLEMKVMVKQNDLQHNSGVKG